MPVLRETKIAVVKLDTLKHDIADGIFVKCQRNPHIFCTEQHIVGRILEQDDVRVSEKVKEATCNRKYMKSRVYHLVHMIAINSNGYTYDFDVKQHDWIDLNTVVCRVSEKSKMATWNWR